MQAGAYLNQKMSWQPARLPRAVLREEMVKATFKTFKIQFLFFCCPVCYTSYNGEHKAQNNERWSGGLKNAFKLWESTDRPQEVQEMLTEPAALFALQLLYALIDKFHLGIVSIWINLLFRIYTRHWSGDNLTRTDRGMLQQFGSSQTGHQEQKQFCNEENYNKLFTL